MVQEEFMFVVKVEPSVKVKVEGILPESSSRRSQAILDTPKSRVMAFYKTQNMTLSQKVEEAIKDITTLERNATYIAIMRWIVHNTGHERTQGLQNNVKKILLKGLKNGTFIRPHHARKAIGMNGSFLVKKKGKAKVGATLNKNTETKKKGGIEKSGLRYEDSI